MKLLLIEDIDEFKACKEDWYSILNEKDNHNPYVSFEWILSWWDFFGEGHRLYILVLKDNERCLGFSPLMVCRSGLLKIYRFIGRPQCSKMCFVVRNNWEKVFLDYIIPHLQSIRGPALIDLCGLCEKDPCFQLLDKMLQNNSADNNNRNRVYTRARNRYLMDFEQESMESFLNRNKKHNTIKRVLTMEQRLSKLCSLEFDRIPKSQVNQIFPLHEKRWCKKTDNNGFGKGELKRFFSNLAFTEDISSFRCQVYRMKAGSLTIAFIYTFICKDTVYIYRLAHDDDFGIYKPGLINIKKCLQCFYDQGFRIVDFSYGDESYKKYWTNKVLKDYQIFFASDSLISKSALYLIQKISDLRSYIKNYPKMVRLKRTVPGKLKYLLTLTPIVILFKKIRTMTKIKSFPYIIAWYTGRLFQCLTGSGIYIYMKKPFFCPKNCCNQISIKLMTLDSLHEMANITPLSPADIVKRYYKGYRCFSIYSNTKYLGTVWLANKEIRRNNRVVWTAYKSDDKCCFDIWLSKRCSQEEMKEVLCSLGRDFSPKGRASLYLLVDFFDKRILNAAEELFKRSEG